MAEKPESPDSDTQNEIVTYRFDNDKLVMPRDNTYFVQNIKDVFMGKPPKNAKKTKLKIYKEPEA